ncbi:hypothetical protein Syun_025939 [Stephania yunnanensis]|uniref:Uncharacterized protein n=1 Tax=Stephania yunnanensis TaxID=152371 RepID=A0AAP0HVS0_9MAGN
MAAEINGVDSAHVLNIPKIKFTKLFINGQFVDALSDGDEKYWITKKTVFFSCAVQMQYCLLNEKGLSSGWSQFLTIGASSRGESKA